MRCAQCACDCYICSSASTSRHNEWSSLWLYLMFIMMCALSSGPVPFLLSHCCSLFLRRREGVSNEPIANRTKNNDSVALFELCCSLPSPQDQLSKYTQRWSCGAALGCLLSHLLKISKSFIDLALASHRCMRSVHRHFKHTLYVYVWASRLLRNNKEKSSREVTEMTVIIRL